MANLPETATYDAGVYQIETTDAVRGGLGGKANAGATNLANRTKYLKAHVDAMEVIVDQADAEAGIATDLKGWTAQRVRQAIMSATGGYLAKSVAGSANVTLTATEAGIGIINLTGAITANIAVIVPTAPTRSWIFKNSTTGAYTVTVKTAAGSGTLIGQNQTAIVYTEGTNVYPADQNNHGKAKFTANGNFVVPQGVYGIFASGCAGGGGGGGGGRMATTTQFGGGGGGGGAGQSINKVYYAVNPGDIIAITIGGAGIGGGTNSSADGDAGTAGGNTVIGSLVTLTGGGGGFGGSRPAGGFGGTGYPNGSDGTDGLGISGTGNGTGNSGVGASSPFGGGGPAVRSTSSGTAGGRPGGNAGGYGAGGGGGSTGVSGIGGNGTPGLALLEW